MAAVSAEGLGGATARLRIGAWLVDPAHNELRRDGETVRLEPKVIEVLVHLARRPGHAVPREELLAAVWPGVIVGDDALTQAIIKLRKALGDDAHKPTYIETISKRGYRLIAPVEGAAAAQRPPPSRRGRWVAALGLAGIVAVLAVVALAQRGVVRMPWPIGPDTRGAASALPTVAVLPLTNLSGDPSREYFVDGMTEDIINGLGRFSGVRVISRSAVQGFKDKSPATQAIHKELGVRYIVQGSVRQADGKLRVTVELSDAEKGTLLGSETHEGEGGQLFEIQERIVRNIVGKLHVKLTQVERERVFTEPTKNLEAHDLVLRARSLLKLSERGANREARSLLARARELAPEYAEVYSALAAAEFQRVTDGYVEDAAQGMQRAEELAKRALTFDDQRAHARAHSMLAALYSHQNRIDDALAQAERAIEINPSDSVALYWRGSALMCAGRIDEAIGVMETARRFEPYPSMGQGLNLAIAYYVAGRPADALAQADALLTRIPRASFLHAMRAAALAQLGRLEEAGRAAAEVRRLDPLFDPDNFGTRFADAKHTARLRGGLRSAGL